MVIGTLIAVATFVALAAVIRAESRAQRRRDSAVAAIMLPPLRVGPPPGYCWRPVRPSEHLTIGGVPMQSPAWRVVPRPPFDWANHPDL